MAHHLNAFFSALSDPTRRAVIERLVTGPATVSDLAAPHDMALPTFLRHLKVLEDSGIVRSAKTGRVRTCRIATEPLVAAQDWLAWQRAIWEGRNDRLSKLAEQLEKDKTP